MAITTKFIEDGADLGTKYITKEYAMDAYPELLPQFKAAGLWTWGRNDYGQLGTNNRTHWSSPVQTVAGGANWKQISCGNSFTAAIKTDGTLWMWGVNSNGQLGTNNTTYYSSPVQTVAGGTTWKQVSCGGSNTAAIKTDGTLWMWGSGLFGGLGTNNTTSRSSPVQTVAGGTNWKFVATGNYICAATKTDGTLWVWGYNGEGALGTNNTNNTSSPVQTITGGTNWKQVSIRDDYVLAIKTDGTLWGWGLNTSGQLGTNDRTNRSSPVQTVAGGNNWKQATCFYTHSAALKTDGTLWTWGENSVGQLGTNDTTPRSSPVQTVAGGTLWKKVVCGYGHTASIKNDGTLWMWGDNIVYGGLGTNNTTPRSSPVQTVAGGTLWKDLSMGVYVSAAIAEFDNLW
jgi:alpha-tubulin suppressor-like RCC1 family protein